MPGHPQNLLGDSKEQRAYWIDVERGTNILDAASRNGVLISTRCGGVADCMTCQVHVVIGAENLSPIDAAEREALENLGADKNTRLACQAELLGDVTVDVPDPADAEQL